MKRFFIFAAIFFIVCAGAVNAEVIIPANSWLRVDSPAVHPPVGGDTRFSYDSISNEIIMFGGDQVCGVGDQGYCRSTWTYNVTTNTWVLRNDDNPSSTFPAGRCQPGLAFDSKRNKTLMYSGCKSRPLGGYSWGGLWQYDLALEEWVDGGTSGPAKIASTCDAKRRLIYDSIRDKAVVVGVNTSNAVDAWELDLNNPEAGWSNPDTSNKPFSESAMYVPVVFDSKRGNYIFLAQFSVDGAGNPDPYFSGDLKYQTITYNPDTTSMSRSKSTAHPDIGGGQHGHEIVYDSVNDVVILYGGNCSNELWVYDITSDQWTKQNPSGDIPPAIHTYFAMAYNSRENVTVVWGRGAACDGGKYDASGPVYLYRYGVQTSTAPVTPTGDKLQFNIK